MAEASIAEITRAQMEVVAGAYEADSTEGTSR